MSRGQSVRVDRPFRTSFMWHLGGIVAKCLWSVIAQVGKAVQR